jgi:hypothetical protein
MNGSNNLARELFLSLDIGPYLLPTWGPLGTFLGLFGGAQIAHNEKEYSIKTCFLVVLDHFS